MIDLRSDTAIRPTAGMRATMAATAVGDAQSGEDPTVSELEARVADLVGAREPVSRSVTGARSRVQRRLYAHDHGRSA